MRSRPTRPAPPAFAAASALSLSLSLALLAGCSPEPRHVAVGPGPGGEPSPAPTPAPAPAAPPAPLRPSGEPDDGFIVGKKTQTVLNAQPELEKGAQKGNTRITRKDYITIQGNAYVSMIGQTSILQIQHAVDLYKATNDRYPADYQEFMDQIIKANNIALPKLPPYQEYGYDEKDHKLIILEYPDRKNAPGPR